MSTTAEALFELRQGAGGIVGLPKVWGDSDGVSLHLAVRGADGAIVPTSKCLWIARYRLRDLARALEKAADAIGGDDR